MRRYLPRLFGGPLDGDVRVLDQYARSLGRVTVAVTKPAKVSRDLSAMTRQCPRFTQEVYRRHFIAPGSMCAQLEVYAHEDMPQHELHRRVWDHLLDRAGATYA